jgi:sarcosine oxidase subunit alpha
MTGPTRLDGAGVIDRSRTLNFTFDGKPMTGHPGDTLASALLANGVRVLARSFKVHRPRGIMAAGAEEANAYVSVGEGAFLDTNVRATDVELYDGLVARSLNSWPSPRFDLGGVLDRFSRFLPAGFYYKTFMWPHWHVFEGFIRRAAGLGKPTDLPDPDRYEQMHAHADVVVVGSGPAGLMAALAAGRAGGRVLLVEQEPHPGGALRWQGGMIDGKPSPDWVADIVAELEALDNVTILMRTTLAGYYDHNALTALERVTDHLPQSDRVGPRQRLWKIRAKEVVLATGAIERPLVFPDNDRPGVMLASAVLRYANEFGVAAGQKIVIFTNNDSAYDLLGTGLPVLAVIDVRAAPGDAARERAKEAGVDLLTHSVISRVHGRGGVKAVTVQSRDGGAPRRIDCDAVAMSGGWNPAVHLFSQSGGKLRFDDDQQCFVPDRSVQAERSAGAAAGHFDLVACLADGLEAGRKAAEAAGFAPETKLPVPAVGEGPLVSVPEAFWMTPTEIAGSRRQWIDFHNDVTSRDIGVAARENFQAVEHLKRYTTLGMALDQGKTSNVNGLAAMGVLTGRDPANVGTTTFRPPYTPMTFGAFKGMRRGDLFAPIQYLPTHDRLVALGAKMEDYGGWMRPAYVPRNDEDEAAAIRREVLAVRGSVGITDYSPLGKVEVKGPDAAMFLNLMLLTNAETIKVGCARYNLMLSETGIVIDDGIVTRLAEDHFLVGTTSGGAARAASSFEEWLQCEWPDMQVFVENMTTAWGVILITGPKARDVMQRLDSDIDFSAEAFPHMAYRAGTICGVSARVHRVSFSGEVSYEVSVPAGHTDGLWQACMAAGADFGITPFGLESLLVMRLEKGFIHVGSDTDGTTVPDDIGFGAVARKQTVDFVGRRSLMRPDALREDRLHLVGLEAKDSSKALPVGGHLVNSSVRSVPAPTEGFVTSSAMSPSLGRPVALALLKSGRGRTGEEVRVYSEGNWYEATVVKPGFYDVEGERING